jgi:hypothetical protein
LAQLGDILETGSTERLARQDAQPDLNLV